MNKLVSLAIIIIALSSCSKYGSERSANPYPTPSYPNSSNQSSSQRVESGRIYFINSFETTDSLKQVLGWYEGKLLAQGWKHPLSGEIPNGLFLTDEAGCPQYTLALETKTQSDKIIVTITTHATPCS